MGKERMYIDWRKNPQWFTLMEEIEEPQIFYEGLEPPEGLSVVNRLEIKERENLIFYSSPPGPLEGREILAKASPRRVYLLFRPAKEFTTGELMEVLLGMVKFDLKNREGKGNLLKMAAASGQRQETIELALQYLACQGLLEYQLTEGGQAAFRLGAGSPQKGLPEAQRKIRNLMEETKAFRRYLSKSPLAQVKAYFA